MFDFLFIGYQKRLQNRLNVRTFVRNYIKHKLFKNATIYLEMVVLINNSKER